MHFARLIGNFLFCLSVPCPHFITSKHLVVRLDRLGGVDLLSILVTNPLHRRLRYTYRTKKALRIKQPKAQGWHPFAITTSRSVSSTDHPCRSSNHGVARPGQHKVHAPRLSSGTHREGWERNGFAKIVRKVDTNVPAQPLAFQWPPSDHVDRSGKECARDLLQEEDLRR